MGGWEWSGREVRERGKVGFGEVRERWKGKVVWFGEERRRERLWSIRGVTSIKIWRFVSDGEMGRGASLHQIRVFRVG